MGGDPGLSKKEGKTKLGMEEGITLLDKKK